MTSVLDVGSDTAYVIMVVYIDDSSRNPPVIFFLWLATFPILSPVTTLGQASKSMMAAHNTLSL